VWTAGDYLSAVDAAIRNERYDHALDLIDEGKERFPEHTPLYLAAGDLYRDEELYEMALGEYRRAAELEPRSYQALHGQSVALGRLNREREAVGVLEEMVEIYPESVEVLSDLGWMYFKTHQLAKGEELLRGALDRMGMNRSLAMTLATIYADMYEYDRAKEYYERAIADAMDNGRSYFASVARYNLSLLEKTFYQFDAALTATEESLRLARRAPGLLARGELHQRRLRYDDALSDYNAAFGLDEDTPLAQVSLAGVHQVFGSLDEALAYAQEVYDRENSAWMFNFGTDLERHGMDVHGLLADIYEGLYHRAGFEVVSGPVEWISRLVRRTRYRVKAWFHRRNERVYARDVAQAYRREGSTLNAAWTFYRAYEDYPGKAMSHLTRAREFETAMIPESRAFYELQAGILTEDPERLQQARSALDPVWERIERAEAAREQAELHKERGERAAYAEATRALYHLNPGGLRQHGLFLPVDLELSVPGFDEQSYRRLARFLARVGLEPVRRETAALRLVITGESGVGGSDTGEGMRLIVALYDGERLRRSARLSFSGMSRRAVRELASSVADTVFAVSP
jgi:tetratricopeptide (TPR) repeat protein